MVSTVLNKGTKAKAPKEKPPARTGTKERIIEAALELFSHKGYDGVGVDQIAEKAGIKGPSLYKHFKSKTDIFNALTTSAESYMDEKLFGSEAGSMPETTEGLCEFTMRQFETVTGDSKIVRLRHLMIKEQYRDSRMAGLITKHYQTRMESLYSGIFENLISKGQVKPYEPSILAMEFISPISLLVYRCDREPDRRQEIRDKIQTHMNHFISVYGA